MKPQKNLSKIISEQHQGKWVAMPKDRSKVIDFSENLTHLRQRIGEENEGVVYMKVLPFDMQFAFTGKS